MKTVQSQQHSQYKEEGQYEDGRSILVALKSYMFSKQLYQKYMNMLHRCYKVESKSFQNYGGRGIGVCFEWLGKDGFLHFYDWCIKNGWSEEKTCKLQIDRIDNDEDYSPTNCQLISQLENMRKMKNLFGIEGRVVKKKPKDNYADVLEKITEVTEGAPEQKLVPLWDWLENLGKNINKSQSSPQ